MSAPSISVVIPSLDRWHSLPRALDSVLAQGRPVNEIIVVDDGSVDGTIPGLARHYPQVRRLHSPGQGVSAARNLGIGAASSQWIALLDSDDRWLPHKIERQLAALADAPGYRLIHSDEIWIRNGVRVNAMKKHAKAGGWIYPHCLPLCAISPSAAMIERSVFDEVGLFDPALPACEDYDLWLRITARMPVLYVDEMLIEKYGGHADQLSRKHWGMDRFRVQALEKILAEEVLDAEQLAMTRTMLLEKLGILYQGALKRDRQQDAVVYQQKIHLHRQAACR